MINIDKDDSFIKLGKTIKIEREKVKLLQYELAKKAKVSRSEINKIENGKANPSIFTFYKIAKALNLNLSDLLKKVNI